MTAILKVDTIQDTAGNNIINESSDTITIGASGDTTNIIGTLQNNGSAVPSTNGITEADQWRLTASITSNVNPIASNLERVDDASFAKIGTGMSVSSGTWSFPTTGLYMVKTDIAGAIDGDDNVRIDVFATTNNSSYDQVAYAFAGANGGATSNTANTTNYINVTDVSNVKVRFGAGSITPNSGIAGDSNFNYSSFTFIRLGDSQ